ncbi:MAG: hypothetical protein HKL80_04205 [Acidimicrobiales bacterium]|nr:hypothetical protein [Acidimicrobiales bacterium]
MRAAEEMKVNALASMAPSLGMNAVTRAIRTAVLIGLAITFVAIVVSTVLGYSLVGFGMLVGLGTAILNLRMMDARIASVHIEDAKEARKGLVLHSIGRLFIATAVIIGSFFISPFLAIGVLLGLVIFQFLLLAMMAKVAYAGESKD